MDVLSPLPNYTVMELNYDFRKKRATDLKITFLEVVIQLKFYFS